MSAPWRMLSGLWLGILLSAGGGCRTPDSASGAYPIGLWGVGRAEDLAAIRRVGFNVVNGRSDKAYLDTADRLGLGVLASTGGGSRGNFRLDRVSKQASQFDSHPALWGWYLADEPDLWGVFPDEVSKVHRTLRSNRAHKPTVVTLCQGYSAYWFQDTADVLIIDRFPVNWMPLANFGQHIQQARLALGPKKRLFATIQAFDWSCFRDSLPSVSIPLRPPTYEEIRCMTYCALAEGANGLFYGCFEDGAWRMTEQPKTWEALCDVVAEVDRLVPLFTAQQRWWPKQPRWEDASRQFNAALQSSISTVWLKVLDGSPAVRRGDYVLAVNNTDERHVYSFGTPVKGCEGADVLGEQRRLPVLQGRLRDEFLPYAVHIYGPLDPVR